MILTSLLPSWNLALDAASKSTKTIISYLDAAKRLEDYLAAGNCRSTLLGSGASLAAERTAPRLGQAIIRVLIAYQF